VLKQVHPDSGMSGSALSTMVNLVKINVSKIVCVMNQLIMRSGAKTLKAKDVECAVRIVLPGNLAKMAVSEGNKAVTKYNAEDRKGTKDKPISKAERAGLTFSVARVEKLMMLQTNASRKGVTASVYLAAVAEYLAAEVLELAGNAARTFHKHRITPRHIKLTVLNDEELNKLYEDTIISGGVVPKIHQGLLPNADEEKPKRSSKPKAVPVKEKAPKARKKATKAKVTKAKTPAKKTAKSTSKGAPKKPVKLTKKIGS